MKMRSVILSVVMLLIGAAIGVVSTLLISQKFDFAQVTKTNDKENSQEPIENGGKVDNGQDDADKGYLINQNQAEDTCIDEKLIFSRISKDKYTLRGKTSAYIGYEPQSYFDKNGNVVAKLSWSGHNKETDEDVDFSCIISSDKDGHTTIHLLQVDGNVITGDIDYKKYRDDGKEQYLSKYRN